MIVGCDHCDDGWVERDGEVVPCPECRPGAERHPSFAATRRANLVSPARRTGAVVSEQPDHPVIEWLLSRGWRLTADDRGAAEQPGTCGYEWVDGWGEHYCHLIDGHPGDHRCHCDFTTRAIRGET